MAALRAALLCKRATDIILCGIGLLLTAPIFALVSLAIVIDSPGSPIFRQKRVGQNGELFEILKFRTMFTDAPNVATELMLKLEKSPITRVGSFLRKSSLDELPQLINVLRGEMSLVGPRPALYNQYELTEKRRAAGALVMKPGITGWAQINGRDELADDEKVEYDRWYSQNWTYWLDWKILLGTIGYVLGRRGAV